jgi:hypothetical protein
MQMPTLRTIRQTITARNNIGANSGVAESSKGRQTSAAFGRPDGALVFTRLQICKGAGFIDVDGHPVTQIVGPRQISGSQLARLCRWALAQKSTPKKNPQ